LAVNESSLPFQAMILRNDLNAPWPSEPYDQVLEIYELALEVPANQQTEYVTRACENDPNLFAQVMALLTWNLHAGAFLEESPIDLFALKLDDEFLDPRIGQRIGNFKIIDEVNSGGMGTVYKAERADGEFEQIVALKVISSGFPTQHLVSRFHFERQVLAKLHHPHIAQLYDGGTTPEGQPYLVMEYVDGVDICTYSDAKKLTVQNRLKMMLEVCAGVQVAHQALIVHCDLKASNILVEADGFPKLLDFGIAGMIAASNTESTSDGVVESISLNAVHLTSRHIALTPAYASPEQLRRGNITAATDIYSLGVLLSVLVSSLFPFTETVLVEQESDTSRLDTLQRKYLSPGSQLTFSSPTEELQAMAKLRQVSLRQLKKVLRGDLDAIISKATAEDPMDRYVSVSDLASDIRAFLETRPVSARKTTLIYRQQKFIYRHLPGMVVGLLLLLLVLGATLEVGWQAHKAELERQKAVRRFNDIRGVSSSIIFELSAAVAKLPGSTSVVALMVNRANQFLDKMTQDADSEPAFMLDLATSYRKLGDIQGSPFEANIGDKAGAISSYTKSIYWAGRSIDVERTNIGATMELAIAYDSLCSVTGATANCAKAINMGNELVRSFPTRQDFAAALASFYQHAASPLWASGEKDHAIEDVARSIAISEQLVKEYPETFTYKRTLSFSYKKRGAFLIMQKKWQNALEDYQNALALDEHDKNKFLDARSQYPKTYAMDDIAFIYGHNGQLDLALDWYSKSLAIRKAASEQDPTDHRMATGVPTVQAYIAKILSQMKHWREALAYGRESYSLRQLLERQPGSGLDRKVDTYQSALVIATTYQAWHREVPDANIAARKEEARWVSLAERLGNSVLADKAIGKTATEDIRQQLADLKANSQPKL
jgi:eukaryotic-like serine/threonine-protein kinase